MSKWKEYKLGDLTEVVTKGTTPTTIGGGFISEGINFIKSEAVGHDGRIDKSTFVFISEETHQKLRRSQLQVDDILFSMAGIFLGKNAIVTQDILPANTNQALAIIRLNKNIALPKYISYYLRQKTVVELVNNMSGQSAQPNINFEEIKSIDVILPPLPEQTAIAEVLSSLDDKIDLLHRQNKTLEQLAETLFRKWFVEENNSKENIELGSLVNTINGVSYKSTELNSSTTAMVSLKSFDRNGGFRIDGFKEFTGKYKEQQTVKEGDLVVAHTDITQGAEVIGNPALVISNPKYTTMVISMDMVKVIPKVDWISIEFLYFLMRTREFKGHCEGNANGSTVLHLSKQAIPTFEFKTPKREKVIEFTRQSKELLSKTFENHRQIRTLTQLRDTLLPELMSGKVRVNINGKKA